MEQLIGHLQKESIHIRPLERFHASSGGVCLEAYAVYISRYPPYVIYNPSGDPLGEFHSFYPEPQNARP